MTQPIRLGYEHKHNARTGWYTRVFDLDTGRDIKGVTSAQVTMTPDHPTRILLEVVLEVEIGPIVQPEPEVPSRSRRVIDLTDADAQGIE